MSANERMNKVEAALADRGVRDVKFFFDLATSAQPASEVSESVCRVMDAYLSGNFSKMSDLNDAIAA